MEIESDNQWRLDPPALSSYPFAKDMVNEFERRLADQAIKIHELNRINFDQTMRHAQENQHLRHKMATLVDELVLRTHDEISGCGCPIGVCARKLGDKGSCWFQWSESHLNGRIQSIRKDAVEQHLVSPLAINRARQREEDAVERYKAEQKAKRVARDAVRKLRTQS